MKEQTRWIVMIKEVNLKDSLPSDRYYFHGPYRYKAYAKCVGIFYSYISKNWTRTFWVTKYIPERHDKDLR